MSTNIDPPRKQAQLHWLQLVYGGDVGGGSALAQPARAERILAQRPEILDPDDPYFACIVGDEAVLRREIERDAEWVNRSGGSLNIPPLIALTHSTLARFERFREPLRRCVRLLLDAGANPDASFRNRFPPHSLEKPGDERLSALYGASGKIHDPHVTQMLLAAGADPNDGESLYHSLEEPQLDLACTRLLLEAGARVGGTNALARVLDFDNLDGLKLLLAHTPRGDEDLNRILLWAIHRGRSAAHVRALLDAGADPRARTHHGYSAYKLALAFGMTEVIEMFEALGVSETVSAEESFIAACARADAVEARRMLAAQPDLIAKLSEQQLRQLPLLAMTGFDAAVKVMVELGWPIATRGGDIDGSALNWAVFRGNPSLTRFLLEHGASWRERHGYDSDVIGTLSWASLNRPRADGDWPACAEALMAHELPPAELQPGEDAAVPYRYVLIDGRHMTFADDVIDVLLSAHSS